MRAETSAHLPSLSCTHAGHDFVLAILQILCVGGSVLAFRSRLTPAAHYYAI